MSNLPILFLLSSLCIGGSERKSVRVVNALRLRGVDVHLAYLNGPETLLPDIDPSVPLINLQRKGKLSWPAVRRLDSYVKKHRISKIICVNLYPMLYVSALRFIMRGRGLACVVAINTTDFHSAKESAEMTLYAPLLRRTDQIVFGCEYQQGYWTERYRLPKSRCGYIYNGVDDKLYMPVSNNADAASLRESFGFGVDDFIIGTVGQLRPEKGHQTLLETVKLLRSRGIKASAIIVGGGPEESALKKMCADLAIEPYVRFLGEVRDVRPALSTLDVFTLTSVAVETFSNAALEAMAMGKPVVLSDIAGAREMVWEGVNGHLFPKADTGLLTSILHKLSESNSLRQQMGREARRIAVEKFSFDRMVDNYEALCSSA